MRLSLLAALTAAYAHVSGILEHIDLREQIIWRVYGSSDFECPDLTWQPTNLPTPVPWVTTHVI
jgi:hypothetical protein